MTRTPVPGWRLLGVVFDGAAIEVGGVNPWGQHWQHGGGVITVPHPSFASQRHPLTVWSFQVGPRTVTFAAGELSNGVWCFYLPDEIA